MEYLLPVTIAVITTLISPIVVEWVKNKVINPKPDPLNEAIKHNEEINHQLEVILDELEGDRVWIAMFHNGGHFYPTGKSIQKFSIFHERTHLESDSIMDTFQNIPVSLFPKCLSKIYKDQELSLSKDKIYDFNFFSKNQDINAMEMFSIKDTENRFIGIMTVEFKNPIKLDKDQYIFIRQKLGIIGGILSQYLKKQK
jgi:hypothetical protein